MVTPEECEQKIVCVKPLRTALCTGVLMDMTSKTYDFGEDHLHFIGEESESETQPGTLPRYRRPKAIEPSKESLEYAEEVRLKAAAAHMWE
jgi:hypothetical protein